MLLLYSLILYISFLSRTAVWTLDHKLILLYWFVNPTDVLHIFIGSPFSYKTYESLIWIYWLPFIYFFYKPFEFTDYNICDIYTNQWLNANRCNSVAKMLELGLFCIKPLKWYQWSLTIDYFVSTGLVFGCSSVMICKGDIYAFVPGNSLLAKYLCIAST